MAPSRTEDSSPLANLQRQLRTARSSRNGGSRLRASMARSEAWRRTAWGWGRQQRQPPRPGGAADHDHISQVFWAAAAQRFLQRANPPGETALAPGLRPRPHRSPSQNRADRQGLPRSTIAPPRKRASGSAATGAAPAAPAAQAKAPVFRPQPAAQALEGAPLHKGDDAGGKRSASTRSGVRVATTDRDPSSARVVQVSSSPKPCASFSNDPAGLPTSRQRFGNGTGPIAAA